MAINGLFPPIVDAYLPAKSIVEASQYMSISIPFSVSSFNSLSDIHGIHISITRQSNYNSLLNKTNYPMGIYVKNVTLSNYSDVFELSSDYLDKTELNYNEYYKVQLRFSKDSNYSGVTGADLTRYLTNESNLENFSEWSTVCLIRFIAEPYLEMSGNGKVLSRNFRPATNTIDTSNLVINGTYNKDLPNDTTGFPNVIMNPNNDLENLKYYIVKLQDSNTHEWVFYSGEIEADHLNNNNIYYKLPFYFNNNSSYTMRVRYTTTNLYNNNADYPIRVEYTENSWGQQSDVVEMVAIDSVIGKVNISLQPAEGQTEIASGSKFVIRRGSDKDNFQYWDTIWEKTLTAATSEVISFNDFTIESGVLYKYEINYIDATNNHNHYFIVEGPVISVFDHAFLTGEGTQLCVKFNPNVNNFKRNVADSVVTTVGGKYPYINRNGDMDYRSFSLSGTIAYEMDAEHQFASRSSMYGEWIEVYGSYFVNRYINQQNDRITQRKFRELVMDYLYSDLPKLFRSTPEGNILVRLTDINLTPNQQLGRMIYDFSCTATEIGDASVENCKLYEIQDFGEA